MVRSRVEVGLPRALFRSSIEHHDVAGEAAGGEVGEQITGPRVWTARGRHPGITRRDLENLDWLTALGAVLAGVESGASVLATFGTFARIARPNARSAVFALANIINYLGNSVPAVLGGIAVTTLGLRTATEIYAVAIVVITLSALVLRLNQIWVQRRAVPGPCS